jgi:hypothetical protein
MYPDPKSRLQRVQTKDGRTMVYDPTKKIRQQFIDARLKEDAAVNERQVQGQVQLQLETLRQNRNDQRTRETNASRERIARTRGAGGSGGSAGKAAVTPTQMRAGVNSANLQVRKMMSEYPDELEQVRDPQSIDRWRADSAMTVDQYRPENNATLAAARDAGIPFGPLNRFINDAPQQNGRRLPPQNDPLTLQVQGGYDKLAQAFKAGKMTQAQYDAQVRELAELHRARLSGR